MQAISNIFSAIVGKGDTYELNVANKMLLSAAGGDVADFRRHMTELFKVMPNTTDALLVTDGNGWTALQLAAATDKGGIILEILQEISRRDLLAEPILDFTGENEMTALVLALNNGFAGIAKSLIDSGASLDGTAPRERNTAFLICRGGHLSVLNSLIHKKGSMFVKKLAECKDTNGYTSLHAAALMGHGEICTILLGMGLDVSQVTRDRSNALHIACRNMKHAYRASSRSTMVALLDNCPDHALLQADTFGSSPLHVALSCANLEAAKCILERFPVAALMCQDNDGLHPTHIACQNLCSLLYQRNSETDESVLQNLAEKVLDAVCCVQELVVAGYPLGEVDYSNYTVFHNLCSHPQEEILQLVGLIIDAINSSAIYSSLSVESVLEQEAANGLTCLHNVYQNDGPCKGQLINLLRKHMNAQFLSSFDENKAKGDSKEHRNRCGAHNRIPLATRRNILNEEYNLNGVANFLKNLGHPPKIVALIGAGISTSAGIPDFRSSTGLYANNATSNMFSVQSLTESPEQFYGRIRDMFLPVIDKTIKPTKTHALLKTFKDAGWLKRVYTQNIDMLEYPMLEEDDVVECHGSCKYAYCVDPTCSHRLQTTEEMEKHFWGPIRKCQLPKCTVCSSYMRPDVVFFGEPLPDRFNKKCFDDLSDCDFLLVMGTTLLVYPVASLPQMVGPGCVRLLINRDPSGCFQGVLPGNLCEVSKDNSPSSHDGVDTNPNIVPQYTTKLYRDVFYKGNCDDGATELAAALGLSAELMTVTRQHC